MPAGPDGIAVLGGTFDPVHHGHLRSALEVREALGFRTARLVPSFVPPHRPGPAASAEDRLAMLRLAVDGKSGFEVDDREIRREGISYTVDTLASMRGETAGPLALVIGSDQFAALTSWHDWQRLTDYAHLVVLARPGMSSPGLDSNLAEFAQARSVDDPLCLHSKTEGLVLRLRLTQLDISATQIRGLVRAGKSAEFLAPGPVIQYIHERGLYRMAPMR